MKDFALDGRLLSVARLVRQGAVFADIGTDHAYLPLALLRDGRISRAVCSDINEGPLSSAMANAREAGLFDKISFHLTDGAAALSGEGITDAAIAGMGGELIADIISRAPFFKDGSVRLILQPMSRQAHLRRFLVSEGFEITDEDYSFSQGKYYVTLAARYTGTVHSLSDGEAELGRLLKKKCLSDEERGYLTQKKRALLRAAEGKRRGGLDASEEEKIINLLSTVN